uniref:Uncharacterized protein n=1 Tax=Aegilops tauschii TaxID=37682 RepID=M8D110_AEGTA
MKKSEVWTHKVYSGDKEEQKTIMDIKEVQSGRSGSELLLKKAKHGFLAFLIVVLNISYSPFE